MSKTWALCSAVRSPWPTTLLHSGDPAYSDIRQLRSIRQSLTTDAMRTLVYAFVSSRIDYCNSILAGVSGQLLQRLQSVQNAAARLVTGAQRSDRMTPILRQLHWLPVRQRITLKTAVLVYRYTGILSAYCEPTSSHGGRCHHALC